MGFNKQHIGDNEGMGTGLGGTNLKSLVTGYVWTNAQAETYYNALKTANGGDINSSSLYGIDLNTYKGAIDTFFVAGTTNGWLSKMTGMYLFQGDNASTQSINAKTPSTHDLVAINSPTYSSAGATLDGATQYFTTDINPSTHITTNDVHLSAYVTGATADAIRSYWGTIPDSAERLKMAYTPSPTGTADKTFAHIYSSTNSINSVTDSINGFWLTTKRALGDMETYLNGASESTLGTNGGTNPNDTIYLMAQNVLGSPAQFMDGTVEIATIGNGVTDAQVLDLYNNYQIFATTIGR